MPRTTRAPHGSASPGRLLALAAALWLGCQSAPPAPEAAPELDREASQDDPYANLGRNLLRNASFEKQLLDWRVRAGARWSADGGLDGSGALVIQAPEPPDDGYIHRIEVEQCVALVGGDKYELSAQFWTERPPVKPYANRSEIVWYESRDCSRGGQWGAFIEPKGFSGWQSLSRTNLTPALNARSAKVTIYQNGRHSAGSAATWDDVQFRATELYQRSEASSADADRSVYTIDVGENYVANGAFDRDLEAWSVYSGIEWSAEEGRATPGAARVTMESESGGRGSGAFDQCINFGEHTRYELGASVKRDERSTQRGGGRLRVTWFQEEDCRGPYRTDGRWVDPQDVAGWQDLRVEELTPLPNARSVNVEAIRSIRGPGTFTLYWDDLYFRPLE